MARYYDVSLVTHPENRTAIEESLKRTGSLFAEIIYHDTPRLDKLLGNRLYYYRWQVTLGQRALTNQWAKNYDLIHHLTYGQHSVPSYLTLANVPLIFGPVGGAEGAPPCMWTALGPRGLVFEVARYAGQLVCRHNSRLKRCIRQANLVLAKARETKQFVEAYRSDCRLLCEAALSEEEIAGFPDKHYSLPKQSISCISVGRILAWKGICLGIRAFAAANIPGSHYHVAGEGPDLERLKALAKRLGVADRVTFHGRLSREQVLKLLPSADILVHPSLHDSGGWTCLEGMAAGLPVICLDIGGPALQVTNETGFRVPPGNTAAVVQEIANAMRCLADNPLLRQQMGEAGRTRVLEHYTWSKREKEMRALYEEAMTPIECCSPAAEIAPKH